MSLALREWTTIHTHRSWRQWSNPASRHLRSDNSPEFISKALRTWLEGRGVTTLYIEPGCPWQNPYSESFHDRLRDECLNMHLLTHVPHAQEVVEGWRKEYNE